MMPGMKPFCSVIENAARMHIKRIDLGSSSTASELDDWIYSDRASDENM